MQFWQAFEPEAQDQPPWTDRYPAQMPDGQYLTLPLREIGDVAVAGLIANQASFHVLDRLTAWTAAAAGRFGAEVVVGLPTLGHTVGAAVARALGHAHWVAPSTTRKRWYDDALSAPLGSITAPAEGANAARRMWLDPRLLDRLQGRRVLLVDDVVSTGRSAGAGLALLRTVGVTPVGLAVVMIQGPAWRAIWPDAVEVVGAFQTPRFHRVPGGWLPDAYSTMPLPSNPHPGSEPDLARL